MKYGLVGSAVLAAGAVGIGLQKTKMRTSSQALKCLTLREFSILSAIVDRMFPENGSFISGSEAKTPELVDEIMGQMPILVVEEFKQALALMENALTGLVFSAKPRPFSQCSPSEQDVILEAWRTSSIQFRRKVFRALNAVCAGAYYGQPDRFVAIGYPGPPKEINPEAFQ